jgi:hypothetical protein
LYPGRAAIMIGVVSDISARFRRKALSLLTRENVSVDKSKGQAFTSHSPRKVPYLQHPPPPLCKTAAPKHPSSRPVPPNPHSPCNYSIIFFLNQNVPVLPSGSISKSTPLPRAHYYKSCSHEQFSCPFRLSKERLACLQSRDATLEKS